MRPKTWVPAAAAVLTAVAAAGAVARDVRCQASERGRTAGCLRHTAKVEKRSLSAMIAQPGTLTYRARPDGLPYSVINRARGAYSRLPWAAG